MRARVNGLHRTGAIIRLNPAFDVPILQARYLPDHCPHANTVLVVDIPMDVSAEPMPTRVPIIRECSDCGSKWVSRSTVVTI